jgi:hypothetical protein
VNTGAAVLFALAFLFTLLAHVVPRITPDGDFSSAPEGYAFLAAVFLFCGLVAV